MVGRGSLIALVASALLLVGGQSAAFAAEDDGIPFEQLVQVYVPDQAADVEAFNKSTKRNAGSNSAFTGPSLALSYAGPDGVYATATNMGRFIDTDPTPDEYMYHRQLVRLTGTYANLSANDIQIRVATAATAGGAAASTETFPVTEWLGKDLPPHVAGFKTEFFTHYQDPTETRADLDALAAKYPELMGVVNMPEKTSGYQRKSQAIMYGTGDIGSAPPATVGTPLINTTGEITAAQPVATIPFTATAGQEILATVDAIPSGETDFILALKIPRRHPADGRHGNEPGVHQPCADHGRHVHLRDLGLPGRSRRLHVQAPAGVGQRRGGGDPRGRAHRQGLGPVGRQPGHGRVPHPDRRQPAAHRRRQRQADRGVPRHRRHRRARARRPRRSSPRSTPSRRPPRSSRPPPTAATPAPASSGPRARPTSRTSSTLPRASPRGPFQHAAATASARTATARRSASSSTASSTPASGSRRSSAWRPRSGWCELRHRPADQALVDNLDIFISRSINPDGAHYSHVRRVGQRKNMVNYCADRRRNCDPAARNAWGVDINRNFRSSLALRRLLRRVDAAARATRSPARREFSEPETRNEKWLADTFPNIKFSMNIHSYGGYFMWAPGSYKDDGPRHGCRPPNMASRTTSSRPPRDDPQADLGLPRHGDPAGAHRPGHRRAVLRRRQLRRRRLVPQRASSPTTSRRRPDRLLRYDHGHRADQVASSRASARWHRRRPGLLPGQRLAGQRGSRRGHGVRDGQLRAARVRLDYAIDTTAPSTSPTPTASTQSKDPIAVTFTERRGGGHLLHDRRLDPDARRPRLQQPACAQHRPDPDDRHAGTTTVSGSRSTSRATSPRSSRSPSCSTRRRRPSRSTSRRARVYTQGRPVPLTFSCADEQGGSGVASCVGSTPSGSNLRPAPPDCRC